MFNLPEFDFEITKMGTTGNVKFGIGCRKNRVLLISGIRDPHRAQTMFNDMTAKPLKVLRTVLQHGGAGSNIGRVTHTGKLMMSLYDLNKPANPQPAAAIHPPQASGSIAVAATNADPKTRQFIGISKELGYDVCDLHEMDDRLKNWIADLVDMSEELDDEGDIDGLPEDGVSHLKRIKSDNGGSVYTRNKKRKTSKSPVFAQPYGTPIMPSKEDEDTTDDVPRELDNWDIMAGQTTRRDGGTGVKKEWEPDTIDPNVDPLEGIR